jgi:hypothetical protein
MNVFLKLLFVILIGVVTPLCSNEKVDYYKAGAKPNFDNVLLIINYNHPYYQSIDFLKEVYGYVFPNIVFYGEKEDPRVKVISHHFGWWGQGVLADAMQCWPDYEGYICVQDDCFMNFWNFARLDMNKIWLCEIENTIPLDAPQNFWWQWWNKSCGQPAVVAAFNQLTKEQKEKLAKSIGPERIGFTYHDFIYVPGRLREGFINFCNIFSNPPVFVELAIPNILMLLDEKDQWEHLNLFWGGFGDVREYTTQFDWFHPIKFSSQSNQEFIRKIVNQWQHNNHQQSAEL